MAAFICYPHFFSFFKSTGGGHLFCKLEYFSNIVFPIKQKIFLHLSFTKPSTMANVGKSGSHEGRKTFPFFVITVMYAKNGCFEL